jgi:hypothetical protein
MLCENSGKDGESEFCIGCGNSVLTGVLEKGANIGCGQHFVCDLVSLEQECELCNKSCVV